MPREAEDLTGQIFGTRKVIKRGETRIYNGKSTIYWDTVCVECGREGSVQGSHLKRENGCPGCRVKVKRRQVEAVVQKDPAERSRSTMVSWGQLKHVLREVSDKAPVEIHKVEDSGRWRLTLFIGKDKG